MKIIIDPYRGGTDIGDEINGQYEKNILLKLSKYMEEKLNNLGISTELVRNNDISLTDEERNSIVNELKDKDDIIIQNRISPDNEFDIIYPLRNDDELPSLITTNLQKENINVDKYYQRRLPTNSNLDYYSITRNTNPNETIIIEYINPLNYEPIIDNITNSIKEYINKKNTYTVKSGDTLYQIAQKYNISVNKLKQMNNLTSNTISIGQKIKVPSESSKDIIDKKTYIVKKGDTLYQIAKQNNTTIDELKKVNNLNSDNLTIGQTITLPSNIKEEDIKYVEYIVKKGDSLYQIAKQYNISANDLKIINNLKKNTLSIGQKLKVPFPKENYILYTITKGDTLYKIAKQYNTTVNKIKILNNFVDNNLSIGQKIKIPR